MRVDLNIGIACRVLLFSDSEKVNIHHDSGCGDEVAMGEEVVTLDRKYFSTTTYMDDWTKIASVMERVKS